MKTKALSLLIWALSKYLGIQGEEERTDQMEDYLAGAWMSPGFRKYVIWRDARIINALANGVGGEPEPRQSYLLKLGQRVEILMFGKLAKDAHNRQELRKRKEKIAEN